MALPDLCRWRLRRRVPLLRHQAARRRAVQARGSGVPQHHAVVVRPAPRLTDRRIGLLGGSFNPAHAGHVHVSQEALRLLGLDEVWWLVSPQNPLKAVDGMAGLAGRMAGARAITAAHPRIRITDLERELGTRYTVDT